MPLSGEVCGKGLFLCVHVDMLRYCAPTLRDVVSNVRAMTF